MHFLALDSDSWYNLPRDDGVAYAAQESWVQNETIRVRQLSIHKFKSSISPRTQENILFGAVYDEQRYEKGKKLVARA